MNDPLRHFLSVMTPVAEEEVVWRGGSIRLWLRVYLTEQLPKLEYITSVRAVLMTDVGCAVLNNADGFHVLPGGRREAMEELTNTLTRELLEETGCSVITARRLGLLHFHHLTAKPSGDSYPYPDFVQAVFAVRGMPGKFAGDPDQYENVVKFVAVSQLTAIELPSYQLLLVKAATELQDSTRPPHFNCR